ncbi:gamma-glutamyl-gamma-aminobutyrate hydrolase family protein [Shewanella maritima]|uniref:glutamine amidotransferase-related protein n=1 Tax=Shewanella maritima TaxID=2520507 RepID=UPI003735B42F
MKRIGISLRSSHATHYHEHRDALARDWYALFAQFKSDFTWIMLPNIGHDIEAYIKQWQLDGIILSGGDDIGAEPIRDTTEEHLINYCIDNQLPLLGICRGAQLIALHYGCKLTHIDTKDHVNSRHQFATTTLPWAASQLLNVNSYHSCAVQLPLPPPLNTFATVEQVAEGFIHRTAPIVGIMWHPERENNISDFDQQLFQWLFK